MLFVPARNEEANIGRCVRSLLLQDYPADYEVIVVDDGSSDRTRAILEQLAAQPESADRLRLLSLSAELPLRWAGKPHALHAGASQARGSWLVFTDADSYWSPSTLRLTLGEALASEIDLLSVVARAGAGRWLESAHVATRPDGHEPPVSATPCQSAVLSPGHDERSVYPVAPLRLRSHRRLCPS
ncbi:glycosyltransferase [Thermogemmatispora sp.]|uniref:glycosyltransferase n=1 Tax=Thermogemmatispora sp. TaxID=1968838 RepID=UPI0035E451A5